MGEQVTADDVETKYDPKYVTETDDGFVVTLRFPVEHSGKKTTQLILRKEVYVADLEIMDKGDGQVKKTSLLAAELAGVSMSLIRKLRSVDFAEVGAVVTVVLGKGP